MRNDQRQVGIQPAEGFEHHILRNDQHLTGQQHGPHQQGKPEVLLFEGDPRKTKGHQRGRRDRANGGQDRHKGRVGEIGGVGIPTAPLPAFDVVFPMGRIGDQAVRLDKDLAVFLQRAGDHPCQRIDHNDGKQNDRDMKGQRFPDFFAVHQVSLPSIHSVPSSRRSGTRKWTPRR